MVLPGQLQRLTASRRSNTFGRTSRDITDPYSILLEGKLDVIRPNLDCLSFNDPFSYAPIDSKDDFLAIRKDFEDGQSLQLISQRSRPGAFLSPDSLGDPNSSCPGVVEIKVVKAGFLFKLEGKRKNVWREWGIILTASQLYFFKDTVWFRNNIINQQGPAPIHPNDLPEADYTTDSFMDSEIFEDNDTSPIAFRPLIDGFQAHSVIKTSDLAALRSTDDMPKKRPSFLLAQKGGTTDWFSGPIDSDIVDWMLKINYAASFNTFYVPGIQVAHPQLSTRKPQPLRRSCSDSSLSTQASEADKKSKSKQKADAQKYFEDHFARKANLTHKLDIIKKQVSTIQDQLKEHERTGKGLKLLAPIQSRTREAVFLSAATLTATLKWKWVELRKLLCYEKYFEMDLEVENEICQGLHQLGQLGSSQSIGHDTIEALPTNEPVNTRLSEMNDDNVPVTSDIAGVRKNPTLLRINTHAHRRTISESSFHTTVSKMEYDQELEVLQTPTSSITSSAFYDARSFAASIHSLASEVSGKVRNGSISSLSRSFSHHRTRSTSQATMSPQQLQRSKSHSVSESKSIANSPSDSELKPQGKRMQMTLRSPGSRIKPQTSPVRSNKSATDRLLVRKEGENITIHGRNFHLVEVNPAFTATPHTRSASHHTNAL